jgi:hypothetical protein
MVWVDGDIYRRSLSLPTTGVRGWVVVALGAVPKYELIHSCPFHSGI